jgi:hypothetical protein
MQVRAFAEDASRQARVGVSSGNCRDWRSAMRLGCLLAILTFASASVMAAQDATTVPPLMHNAKAPQDARVFIVTPADGATVGQDVHIVFGVSGIAIAPATDATPDTGHHHLLIDVEKLPPLGAPIPADANHKHYGKGQTEDTIHLSPGTHTLQLNFADYRHVQFAPPIVSKKITIHVK